MSTGRRVVAFFRKATYSPNQHRTNDTAILEETLARFIARGWSATRLDESTLDGEMADRKMLIPGFADDDEGVLADLYLNMCQGEIAANALRPLEEAGACILNRPSSVLACHRHRLVPSMLAAGIPFPATEIVDLATVSPDEAGASPLVQSAAWAREPIWIKRGDVHAERNEDVVMVPAHEVARAVDLFSARGITRISLQRHVAGPVIKFYAVADCSFFRYYEAGAGPSRSQREVNEGRLREVAFSAAEAVGLSIFGGDIVLPSPNDPILIDLNDWPSFASFRSEAAEGIAAFALKRVEAYSRRAAARPSTRDHSTPSSPFAPDPV